MHRYCTQQPAAAGSPTRAFRCKAVYNQTTALDDQRTLARVDRGAVPEGLHRVGGRTDAEAGARSLAGYVSGSLGCAFEVSGGCTEGQRATTCNVLGVWCDSAVRRALDYVPRLQ